MDILNSIDLNCALASTVLAGRRCRYVAIDALCALLGTRTASVPHVVRVLLENVVRTAVTTRGDEREALRMARRLASWPSHVGQDARIDVARVLLPDSSGLPVLQDLAALRDAMARLGHDPEAIDLRKPVDLVVDHSVQVDHWGHNDALVLNMRREIERNDERFRFLKWAQQAFANLRVHPPGTGIIHQIHIERIAQVVRAEPVGGEVWAYPEFVVGCDSHTPMVNALGVLGWGVGGIEAEAALLGHGYGFAIAEVVGVRLTGAIPAGSFTTDAALLITQVLRRARVANCMVEFFGPAVERMAVADRATIANMAPEYGATCGFFAVDRKTIDYLEATGRHVTQTRLVEAYCRTNALFQNYASETPEYSRVIEIDLSSVRLSLSGPTQPQHRMALSTVAADFLQRLSTPLCSGGFDASPAAPAASAHSLGHGSLAIAAITSCTNTSNPSLMLAAGHVARRAVELGLRPPPWVKTTLAPGSRAVTDYLGRAGLLTPLERLGFHVVGYGCMTCSGKSGPLIDEVSEAVGSAGLVVASVLSGNRNFEARIHRLVRANYLGAPALVVAYALAGRITIDLDREAIGHDHDGKPVFLQDLLPSADDLNALLAFAEDPALYRDHGAGPARNLAWESLTAPTGPRFSWSPTSTYLVEPPFFNAASRLDHMLHLASRLRKARVLAAFGDSLTTDHISPSGEIPLATPAGRYLSAQGVTQKDFNNYVSRRSNYHVMVRGTFSNVRLKNLLLPDAEGGLTRHFPSGEIVDIFETAMRYAQEETACIVLAGDDYGVGSSRDWAAKGTALLGIDAVLAGSFERIHRANLVGMGVLPLQFDRQGWRELGLRGDETFAFHGIERGVSHGDPITVTAMAPSDKVTTFTVHAQITTQAERRLMREGGILRSVLSKWA